MSWIRTQIHTFPAPFTDLAIDATHQRTMEGAVDQRVRSDRGVEHALATHQHMNRAFFQIDGACAQGSPSAWHIEISRIIGAVGPRCQAQPKRIEPRRTAIGDS